MGTSAAVVAPPPTADRQVGVLWEHLRGFHAVHLISVGIDAGLWEALKAAQPATADALAAARGLHAPYVATWCKTAVSYGLLDAEGEDRYRFAPFMAEILSAPGHPLYLGAYVKVATAHIAADFARAPALFRSGGVHSFQDHGAEFSRLIADTTGGLQTVVARKLLPAVPGLRARLEAGARLLDVGCGAAGLMLRIAEAWPSARCHGVDIDAHGVAAARERIAAAGLSARVTVELAGPDGPRESDAFDVATMFEVLHEIAGPYRAGVLAQTFRALKPGGTLFVLDETYPSTAAELRDPDFAFSVQTGWNELVWGNVVPTRAEQEALLAEAGFVDLRRDMVAGTFTLLVARKPA